MKRYNPKEIEPKWQKKWLDDQTFQVTADQEKPKKYIIDMFPYPSGAAMHVGHVRNFTISDVLSQYHRQKGYNVLHTMGWDTFGLPAENYAIKTGTPPAESTKANIANFKHQLSQLGMSYDWSREINTSDPEYYKWTQWIFTQLFKNDLAYQSERAQWWCGQCKTVLANEQVVNGKCWRHDGADDPQIAKKTLNQWFFKTTAYADKLLEGIEDLDWPEKIKAMQRNWIGKSKGAEIEFQVTSAVSSSGSTRLSERQNGQARGSSKELDSPTRLSFSQDGQVKSENDNPVIPTEVEGSDQISRQARNDTIRVFTTRPDTLFGATFIVLAPEHELVSQITTEEQKAEVEAYIAQTMKKSELERQENKEKTGVFTGAYAVNPVNDEKIPVWIADYVLTGYGTGAIMAVPAHDERDFEFAQKFQLPITQVIMPDAPDPNNPPAPGLEEITRDTVVVHLKDKSNGKFAILDWHGTLEGISTAIMGGVDPGQTHEDAVRTEIKEEAGLENVEIVKESLWTTSARYFASHKKQNRRSITRAFLATIDNLENQKTINLEEEKLHTLRWIDEVDVMDALIPVEQKLIWSQLQKQTALSGEGEMMNSGSYDGISSSEAREKIVADLAAKGVAEEKVNYKIRDWLISRQRYWGAPIPIVHCQKDGAVAVPEDQLPVKLPEVESFAPTGKGSVLATIDEWVNTECPKCGGPAKRETDTMDGYACSSWYFLRYTDPSNSKQAWDPEAANYWLPIDYYCGGDHAVSHLLYSRFWMHFFADQGWIEKTRQEPVGKLVYNGYILAHDGNKMSKSKGNVVNPDELIEQGYGADSLRLFEMFIAPYDQDTNWNTNGVPGTFRFLQRFWTLVQEYIEQQPHNDQQPTSNGQLLRVAHKAIKQISEDLDRLSFNTAVASLMEAVNALYKIKAESGYTDADNWVFALTTLTQLLAPFAPHISEELWVDLGQNGSVHTASWPVHDESYLVSDTMKIVVQVNGKVRATLDIAADSSEEAVLEAAKANEKVAASLGDNSIKKSIYVPNKLVNFVV